jgi:hypothetical protein
MLAAGIAAKLSAVALAVTATATATVGVGVKYPSYIGDTPNAGAASTSFTGTEPIMPGTSAAWTVTWVNMGNVAENLTIGQDSSSAGWMKVIPLPASWIKVSGPAVLTGMAPGASTTRTITVTVPRGAKAGLYGGVMLGTAVATLKGTGNVTNAVGAGDREYVRVSEQGWATPGRA